MKQFLYVFEYCRPRQHLSKRESAPFARYSGRAVEALPVIKARDLPNFDVWVAATAEFDLKTKTRG